MSMANISKITIENRIPEIARALDFVEEFARAREIAFSVTAALAVCVDELLNNLINYGYTTGGMHRIDVTLSTQADALCVCIEDDGDPFDPRAAIRSLPPLPEEPELGGYGLLVVSRLADVLDYGRSASGNVTTVKKFFPTSTGEPQEGAARKVKSGRK